MLLKYVEAERNSDPFLTGATMDNMPTQVMVARSGASLEMGMYICQAIGAFPYTNFRYRWEEILGARAQFNSEMETWTPLTQAFQALNFKFLDHVRPEFAFKMREEGRLGGFRSYLRSVWKAADGSPEPEKANELARDFSDGLAQSYQEAKAEWREIDGALLKWLGGGGIATGIAAGLQNSLSQGKLSLSLPLSGFAMSSVTQLLAAHMKRKSFRQSVPMSIFVDLDNQAR